jgi:hypothetical protein
VAIRYLLWPLDFLPVLVSCATKNLAAFLPSLARPIFKKSGANPTMASYNASVAKIYNATNSMARFRIKIILLRFKNALAYYNAGTFKTRRIGSWLYIT